jgi:adenylate cyclase
MGETRSERRLAAIVAADVVDYSRLMGVDEEGTLAAFKAMRSELLDRLVAECKGRVFKSMGDGVLAEFGSVVQAVDCATQVQREMRERNRDVAPEVRLELRVGIHLGDVIVEDLDVFGDGVNIAARLEAIAPPGGICLSDDAARQIRGKLDLDLVAKGAQRLKNIADPINVWTWLPEGWRAPAPASGTADRASVAMLPFVNLGADAESEYFVDGLTEEIITQLSRVPGLFVIGRNSAFAYKGKAMRAQEIGRELGVDYLVEGSVRRAGSRVRVTVQLVEAASAKQLWAERYDRELADIFELQDELAEAVIGTLPGRLEAANMLRVTRKRPEDMAAYDYLLRGKIHHHRRTPADNRTALEALNRALELDPAFATAQAWKVCVLGQAMIWGWPTDDPFTLPVAIEAVNKALALDPNEVDSHRILCEIFMVRREWDKAEMHHQRALSLCPNYPLLVAQRGELLTWLGQAEEAVPWIERAKRRDTYEADLRAHLLGRALYALGRHVEAASAFRRVPGANVRARAELAAAYAQAGMVAEAERTGADVLRSQPDFTVSAYVVGLPYRNAEDRAHLQEGMLKAGLPK